MFELIKKAIKVNTLKLVAIATFFYILCAFIIYAIEPENFKNPFIGLWWVMTTVTTVGFGDYSPETYMGMVFGMFLYFSGIGLIGIILGKIVDSFTLYRRFKEEGKLSYRGENHFVLIGWSKKAQKTLDEILINEDNQSDIVLIDQLDKIPVEHENLYYLYGDPTKRETLEKANVLKSNSVTIFASDNEDEVSADGKSLLIASAIEIYGMEHNKDIYTIVEMVRDSHVKMFNHVKINEFLPSNDTFPFLMAKSMQYHGSSHLFMQLLSKRYGDDLWKIKPHPTWKTYRDAFHSLQEKGANLISANNDLGIIRRLDEAIPKGTNLFIICDKETFHSVQQK
ncbi:voltage-gated potassium channel [Oceanobacillus limi]|uniref:Voltage-gated potassium channel n=1 Tax=Oceanobacillus limi TaxID=930131 RepID=A0A1I0C5U2_9BACI|nr:potassium channel family protein [Oceanobacillus limi]SET14280.1 voltage-gated potassium channel [Oceanobacillus limi]